MRKVLFVAAIVFASLAPLVASQQTPPPPPPPKPATVPAAPTPPYVKPPTVAPRQIPTPAVRPVPSVAPPVIRLEPTQPGAAQAPTPRPGLTITSTPPTAPTAAQPTSWQNVKLEVTISDSLNVDTQTKKTVSMLILDGRNGQVRSTSDTGLINIDARPTVRPDGRIYLQLTMEYRPELTNQQAQQTGTSRVAMFNESLALIVIDGKPIIASQSADPRSDRKVVVEVTASIIK